MALVTAVVIVHLDCCLRKGASEGKVDRYSASVSNSTIGDICPLVTLVLTHLSPHTVSFIVQMK
jgi:hypothetical protein